MKRAFTVIALLACTPAAAGAAPSITRFSRGLSGHPLSIAPGPGRSMWFTEFRLNGHGLVGRITHSGKIREFSRGINQPMYAGNAPITAGPDGNVWFGEAHGNGGMIARITPRGKVTSFPKSAGGLVDDMTAGPGGAVWFTQESRSGGRVCRIVPSGGLKCFRASAGGITVGPDGDLWAPGARVTPAGEVTPFAFTPAEGATASLVFGPSGDFWFSGWGRIGTFASTLSQDPGGYWHAMHERQFSIGKPQGYVHQLAVGPGGKVWFAAQNEKGFGKVGYLTAAGKVKRLPYRLGGPSGDFEDGIARGADNDMWLTDSARNGPSAIVRINTG